MSEKNRNITMMSPIDTESRIFNFVDQFLVNYNKATASQPYLNVDDILKILAKSLDSSVAFISTSLTENPNHFKVIYLYIEEVSDVHLTTDSEFGFNSEVFNNIQYGKPYAWDEEDGSTQRDIPDLYSNGIKNFFAIQYEGLSGPQILIVGNRKKHPQGESTFYISYEAIVAKVLMEIMGKLEFDKHLKSYKESRGTGYRGALLKTSDELLNFANCLEKQNVLDKYLFKSLDLKIALQVRPTKIAKKEDIQKFSKFLQDKISKSQTMSLPQLALMRGYSWLCYKDPGKKEAWQGVINDLDKKININFYDAVSQWETIDPDVPIEDIPTTVEKSAMKVIGKFYLQYRLPLEYLRTQLFRIYVECLKQKGIAGITALKNITDYIYYGKTKSIFNQLKPILWEYLSKWEHNGQLTINSDWLRCYLGVKILDSKCLDYYLKLKKSSDDPEKSFTFFRHLTTFLLFNIHCIRNHGDSSFLKFSDTERGFEDVIEAQIYLLSELAHVDGNLSRGIRLFDDTVKMWLSEAILYTVSDAYREHLYHALDCCVLGFVLLDSGIYSKLCPDCKPICPDPALIKNWILIGLLHDVGYSLDACYQIIQHMEFLESPQIDSFIKKLKKFLNKTTKDTAKKLPHNLQIKIGNKLVHEIVSALHMLYLKKDEDGKSDNEWAKNIRIAIDAVKKHHLRGGNINPKKEPLAFLLLLCDQLQEWDRPRIDSIELRKLISTRLLRRDRKEIEQHTLLQQIKTNLTVDVKKYRFKWKKNKLFFELLFNDAGEEGFEPAVIWSEKSYNFKHIEKNSLDVNIEIKLIHPISKTLNDNGLDFTEMNLFKTFVREQQEKRTALASLSYWLEEINNGKYGLQYQLNDTEKSEHYSINLKDASQIPDKNIRYAPEELYTSYTKWKKEYLQNAKLKKIKK